MSGDYEADKKKRVAIITGSSLLLVAMVVGAVVSMNPEEEKIHSKPVSSSMKAVESICQPTDYRDTCIKSLTAASNRTDDPKELVKASFEVSIEEIVHVAEHSKLLKSFEEDPVTAQAAQDCKELFNAAVHDFKRSIDGIRDFDFDNIDGVLATMEIWLSATITYQETCLDGFENTTGHQTEKLRKLLQTSMQMSSNGLAIVNGLSAAFGTLQLQPVTTTENRQLQSLRNRRLLTSTSNANLIKSTSNRYNIFDGVMGSKLKTKQVSVDRKPLFPGWVDRKRHILLESSTIDTQPDVTVAQDGSGKYKTIAEALKDVPKYGNDSFIIYVKQGVYKEYLQIDKWKTNVVLIGDGPTKTRITGNKNFVDGTPTFKSATVAVKADHFMAKDIGFENTAGAEKHQAVALRVQSDQSIFFNCAMDGYQDTLYVHTYRQFYRDCTISGTIDFVFGDAASFFQNCTFVVRKPLSNQNCIVTAQGRKERHQPTGIIMHNCTFVAEPDYLPVSGENKAYLGRPWKEFSKTIIMDSYIGGFIDPEGWLPWTGDFGLNTCYYGEFRDVGPGAGQENRVKWKGIKHIVPSRAHKFMPPTFFHDDDWIKTSGVPYIPNLSFDEDALSPGPAIPPGYDEDPDAPVAAPLPFSDQEISTESSPTNDDSSKDISHKDDDDDDGDEEEDDDDDRKSSSSFDNSSSPSSSDDSSPLDKSSSSGSPSSSSSRSSSSSSTSQTSESPNSESERNSEDSSSFPSPESEPLSSPSKSTSRDSSSPLPTPGSSPLNLSPSQSPHDNYDDDDDDDFTSWGVSNSPATSPGPSPLRIVSKITITPRKRSHEMVNLERTLMEDEDDNDKDFEGWDDTNTNDDEVTTPTPSPRPSSSPSPYPSIDSSNTSSNSNLDYLSPSSGPVLGQSLASEVAPTSDSMDPSLTPSMVNDEIEITNNTSNEDIDDQDEPIPNSWALDASSTPPNSFPTSVGPSIAPFSSVPMGSEARVALSTVDDLERELMEWGGTDENDNTPIGDQDDQDEEPIPSTWDLVPSISPNSPRSNNGPSIAPSALAPISVESSTGSSRFGDEMEENDNTSNGDRDDQDEEPIPTNWEPTSSSTSLISLPTNVGPSIAPSSSAPTGVEPSVALSVVDDLERELMVKNEETYENDNTSNDDQDDQDEESIPSNWDMGHSISPNYAPTNNEPSITPSVLAPVGLDPSISPSMNEDDTKENDDTPNNDQDDQDEEPIPTSWAPISSFTSPNSSPTNVGSSIAPSSLTSIGVEPSVSLSIVDDLERELMVEKEEIDENDDTSNDDQDEEPIPSNWDLGPSISPSYSPANNGPSIEPSLLASVGLVPSISSSKNDDEIEENDSTTNDDQDDQDEEPIPTNWAPTSSSTSPKSSPTIVGPIIAPFSSASTGTGPSVALSKVDDLERELMTEMDGKDENENTSSDDQDDQDEEPIPNNWDLTPSISPNSIRSNNGPSITPSALTPVGVEPSIGPSMTDDEPEENDNTPNGYQDDQDEEPIPTNWAPTTSSTSPKSSLTNFVPSIAPSSKPVGVEPRIALSIVDDLERELMVERDQTDENDNTSNDDQDDDDEEPIPNNWHMAPSTSPNSSPTNKGPSISPSALAPVGVGPSIGPYMIDDETKENDNMSNDDQDDQDEEPIPNSWDQASSSPSPSRTNIGPSIAPSTLTSTGVEASIAPSTVNDLERELMVERDGTVESDSTKDNDPNDQGEPIPTSWVPGASSTSPSSFAPGVGPSVAPSPSKLVSDQTGITPPTNDNSTTSKMAPLDDDQTDDDPPPTPDKTSSTSLYKIDIILIWFVSLVFLIV